MPPCQHGVDRRDWSRSPCTLEAVPAAGGVAAAHPACPGDGDCCVANGTPACDNPDCCDFICFADPFCCDQAWDALCAATARDECAVCADPCPLDCPPGAVEEAEACGDDTNGGCLVDPPAFEPLAPWTVVCGTAWMHTPYERDSDWYIVHVDDPDGDGTAMIAATLDAEFWSCCFIFEVGNCDFPSPIGTVQGSNNCEGPGTSGGCVDAPGDYIVRVTVGGCADGWPYNACGTLNNYHLCVAVGDTCETAPAPCLPPDPCPWDCGDGNGQVGVVDFLTLLAQWGTPDTCDFDGAGVGVTDFLTLLANWGVCHEPTRGLWRP
jgi:hypothetical protein